MLQRSVKVILLPLLLSFLFSCHKEKIDPLTPPTEPEPSPISNQELLLAGYSGQDPVITPAYWKGGNFISLSEDRGALNAVSSDAMNVYALGYLNASITKTSLWTNGTLSQIDGIGNDIAVAGNDIYVVGVFGNDAALWKNGNPTLLTHGLGVSAQANRVIIQNGIVHVGIRVLNNDLFSYTTIYWKNGTSQTLSTGAGFGDMIVSGADVYILGTESGGSVRNIIWKNGVPFVTFGGKISSVGKNYQFLANAIDILNGFIYVSGIQNDFQSPSPCYWKINLSNKEISDPILLSYTASPKYIYQTSISVVGDKVYISAYDDGIHRSLLWENGKLVAPFDGSSSSPNFCIKQIVR